MAVNSELDIPLGKIDWRQNLEKTIKNGVNKFREMAPSLPVHAGNYPEIFIEGLTPLDRKARAAVELLTWVFVPKIVTFGAENFKKAQLLSKNYSVFFVSNHLSMADFPVGHQAIVRRGMPDQANRLVPLVGLKEEDENVAFKHLSTKEKLNQFLKKAYQYVPVFSPKRECKTVLERDWRRQINGQASNTVKRLILNDYHPVVTPEATRSRGKGMLEAEPMVGLYFKIAQDVGKIPVIFPVALWGTEKIWPAESNWPVKPGIAIVSCGEPFEVPTIRGRFPLSQYKSIVTETMQRIAVQLPPGYRGFYA